MKNFRYFPLLFVLLALPFPLPTRAFPISQVQGEINQAVRANRHPIGVFDLDETLLHTARRKVLSYQATLQQGLMMFSMKYPRETDIVLNTPAVKLQQLLTSGSNQLDSKAWLGRLGIQNELFRKDLDAAMLPVYLSNQFMHLDRAIQGAEALLSQFYRAGGEVYFVSSRYRTQQLEATIHRLVLSRLFSNARQSHVILREDDESSLDFKVRAFNQIRSATQLAGRVVLVAENEPENLNAMMRIFPAALPVYVVGAVLNTSVTVSPNARLLRTKTYLPGSLDLR
jgi:phosphoglycolate phosphatase-like HAD superfamily hydrolase